MCILSCQIISIQQLAELIALLIKLTTYRYTVSGIRDASHENKFPHFLRHYAYVIILLQVEVDICSRGVADNADVSLVGVDLDSVDDVHDELFDNEPVEFSDAGG